MESNFWIDEKWWSDPSITDPVAYEYLKWGIQTIETR